MTSGLERIPQGWGWPHTGGEHPSIIAPPDWTTPLPLDDLYPDSRPLVVDVGCGKGRFLATRAAADHAHNYLGVDRQLVRLRKTAKKLHRLSLTHVRLLRVEASYAINYLVPDNRVAAYFILFPDPWPKKRHHKRRLFTAAFLDSLDRTLAPDGCIHFATDHLAYFDEVHEVLATDERFESKDPFVPSDDERSEFETIFLEQGATIGRCSFRRSNTATTT
tara:strand:+ start:484 stop:1143 length:660 start_codon:yes stop_codon:yes gene_type:complete